MLYAQLHRYPLYVCVCVCTNSDTHPKERCDIHRQIINEMRVLSAACRCFSCLAAARVCFAAHLKSPARRFAQSHARIIRGLHYGQAGPAPVHEIVSKSALQTRPKMCHPCGPRHGSGAALSRVANVPPKLGAHTCTRWNPCARICGTGDLFALHGHGTVSANPHTTACHDRASGFGESHAPKLNLFKLVIGVIN